MDGEAYFDYEAILDARKIKGRWKFLIKWKGFSESENTWGPRSSLSPLGQKDAKAFLNTNPHLGREKRSRNEAEGGYECESTKRAKLETKKDSIRPFPDPLSVPSTISESRQGTQVSDSVGATDPKVCPPDERLKEDSFLSKTRRWLGRRFVFPSLLSDSPEKMGVTDSTTPPSSIATQSQVAFGSSNKALSVSRTNYLHHHRKMTTTIILITIMKKSLMLERKIVFGSSKSSGRGIPIRRARRCPSGIFALRERGMRKISKKRKMGMIKRCNNVCGSVCSPMPIGLASIPSPFVDSREDKRLAVWKLTGSHFVYLGQRRKIPFSQGG